MQDALIPDQDHIITLSSFEGPLDLLLYLIKKKMKLISMTFL